MENVFSKKTSSKLTIKLELPFNPMSWYVIRVGFRVSPPCRVTKIFPLEVWSHSSCREPSLVFPSVRPLAKRGRVPLFRAGHDPNSAYVLEDDWNLRLCTTCNGGKKNNNKSENGQQLFIQIAKRFDSLNDNMPPTNDHFKRHSVTYEWPLNYEWPIIAFLVYSCLSFGE